MARLRVGDTTAVFDAADEIERLQAALRKVAYSRPAGPLRNKLAERYEKVARAALEGEKKND